jgi:hypothetical protein
VLSLAGWLGLSVAACYDGDYRDLSLDTAPVAFTLAPGENRTFEVGLCRADDRITAYADLALALEAAEGEGTLFVSVKRPSEELWYREVRIQGLKLYAIESYLSTFPGKALCATPTRVSIRLRPQALDGVGLTWSARLDVRTDARADDDLTLELHR